MAEEQQASHADKHAAPPPGAKLVHRVCTQCNQMFPVMPDNFEAKQCPKCHKG
jgi:GMP synthase-like glutamine amidotransferase